MSFPVISELARIDGCTYLNDESVPPSTATALGEITVPTLTSQEEQLAEVKRRVWGFVGTLQVDDHGRMVLVQGGGSSAHVVLDERGVDGRGARRVIQYNRQRS